MSEKSFFQELKERKVFREVKAYLFGGAAMIPLIWLVVSLLGYSDETTKFITKIVVVIFISFFPSVFLFAYYHGESKNTPWSKAETIGIPLNLIMTFFLVFLFFNQDLNIYKAHVTESMNYIGCDDNFYKNGNYDELVYVQEGEGIVETQLGDLKYHNGLPVIKEIMRVSKPGRRIYAKADSISKIHNGLGLAIVSTSIGIMSDNDARMKNVGGEIICKVF